MQPFCERNEQAYDFVRTIRDRDHPPIYFYGTGHEPHQPVPNIPPSHQAPTRFWTQYRGHLRNGLREYPVECDRPLTVKPRPLPTAQPKQEEVALPLPTKSRYHSRCCESGKREERRRRLILVHSGWQRLTESVLGKAFRGENRLLVMMAQEGLVQGELEYEGTGAVLEWLRERGFRVSWGRKVGGQTGQTGQT